MSPYELKILLHYYVSPEDCPELGVAPIWDETVLKFMDTQLLEKRVTPRLDESLYYISPRGEAYIEAILRLPLPVQRWMVEYV